MDLTIGIALVICGGALEGLFSLPVTRTPRWQWENIWGLGSLLALVLVPWPVVLLTVPDVGAVYRSVDISVVAWALLFGVGWGLGGIFWGKGIAALGVALGVSLLMGLINIFGSPVLLAFTEGPAKLLEPGGLTLLLAVGVMIAGVAICSMAGALKERELAGSAATTSGAAATMRTPFLVGLGFCIVSGLLSALVNFGFVYGEPLKQKAIELGARPAAAPNVIWAMVFTGNYAVNAIYAFGLMFRNKTLGRLVTTGGLHHWAWALFMGIAWPLGIVLYGIGAGRMGSYGAFVGFPMMLVMAILFGNLAGALTGEWRDTSSRPRMTMLLGVAVLVVAFLIFGIASRTMQ